jgi:hypothetical protein
MRWILSTRNDPLARPLADRHYNRQKVGSEGFVPPGRCIVLRTEGAFWVTSWPFAEYVLHEWGGAWLCSAFRNENPENLSSELILEAVAATRWKWPEVPELGMVTFVDTRHVRSSNPGYCYQRAGFEKIGHTKGGLVALQMLEVAMPPAEPPLNGTMAMAI